MNIFKLMLISQTNVDNNENVITSLTNNKQTAEKTLKHISKEIKQHFKEIIEIVSLENKTINIKDIVISDTYSKTTINNFKAKLEKINNKTSLKSQTIGGLLKEANGFLKNQIQNLL